MKWIKWVSRFERRDSKSENNEQEAIDSIPGTPYPHIIQESSKNCNMFAFFFLSIENEFYVVIALSK